MYLGREKDLRKKSLKDAEKKAGLGNPGERRCLIHCLWLLRWPKGSVTEHTHWTQFLCLGFDFLCPKIVGELWVRKGLQQRAVFMLAWGLYWLACLQTAPIKDSLRNLNDNNHLSIKQTCKSRISGSLWGSILPSEHKPTRYTSARVCSKGKERMGTCGEAPGPLQKFSNWLFLLWPCHLPQGTARAQLLPAVLFCDSSLHQCCNQA